MRKHADAEMGGFTVDDLATVQMEPLLEAGRPAACLPHQIAGPRHRPPIWARSARTRAFFSRHHAGAVGPRTVGVRPAANDLVLTPDQERSLRLSVKTRTSP
jgi:hypothetical protein